MCICAGTGVWDLCHGTRSIRFLLPSAGGIILRSCRSIFDIGFYRTDISARKRKEQEVYAKQYRPKVPDHLFLSNAVIAFVKVGNSFLPRVPVVFSNNDWKIQQQIDRRWVRRSFFRGLRFGVFYEQPDE
jgi:hypothetical protein